jgi:Flp pilus assembly protein TadG
MRKKKGQAMLEIALVMPVIILIFCGIVDFGRILQASAHLNMISQEAVRLAGFGKNDDEIAQYIRTNADLSDKDTITVNVTPASRKSGDYVTVTITYPVKYITPLVNIFLTPSFVVSTKSTIRVE